MSKLWAVAVPLFLIALPAVGAGSMQRVADKQIRALFTGMEFTDEESLAMVFNRDGTLSIFAMGSRSTGRWRIDKGMLCLVRDEPGERCFEVRMADKNVQLKEPGIDAVEEGILQKPASRN